MKERHFFVRVRLHRRSYLQLNSHDLKIITMISNALLMAVLPKIVDTLTVKSETAGANLSAFLCARRVIKRYPRAMVKRSPNRIANWF
ncbi:hypothetical protein, partial [Paraburkholderia sp. GAS82]|uniref:hypothetical protein n=1 Tax=Paraburkholderia sp. GAS82 TaxID=3035137 RepID=UPI003D1E084E